MCATDLASASSALIKTASQSCKRAENASDKDVDDLSNGIAPETPEGKCLAACMGKKYNIIKDNKLSKDGLMGALAMMTSDKEKKEKVGEVADKCLETADEDRCESAYKIWKCIEDGAKARDFELF